MFLRASAGSAGTARFCVSLRVLRASACLCGFCGFCALLRVAERVQQLLFPARGTENAEKNEILPRNGSSHWKSPFRDTVSGRNPSSSAAKRMQPLLLSGSGHGKREKERISTPKRNNDSCTSGSRSGMRRERTESAKGERYSASKRIYAVYTSGSGQTSISATKRKLHGIFYVSPYT